MLSYISLINSKANSEKGGFACQKTKAISLDLSWFKELSWVFYCSVVNTFKDL
jgi:hypothetical protein